jgi:hypothetical protein
MSFVFEVVSCEASKHYLEELGREDFRVYSLDGEKIRSEQTFFVEMYRSVLNEEYPPGSAPNWDSLGDKLWWALASRSDEKVAFVWRDFHSSIRHALPTVIQAIEVIAAQAESLARNTPDRGQRVRLHDYLEIDDT